MARRILRGAQVRTTAQTTFEAGQPSCGEPPPERCHGTNGGADQPLTAQVRLLEPDVRTALLEVTCSCGRVTVIRLVRADDQQPEQSQPEEVTETATSVNERHRPQELVAGTSELPVATEGESQ